MMSEHDDITIIQKNAIELTKLFLGLNFAVKIFRAPPRVDPTFMKLMSSLVKHLQLDPKTIKFDIQFYNNNNEREAAQFSANRILSELLATIETSNDPLNISSNSQVANIIIQLKLMFDLLIKNIHSIHEKHGWLEIFGKLVNFIEKHQFFHTATALENPGAFNVLKNKRIDEETINILELADNILITISCLLEQPNNEEIKYFLLLLRQISSPLQDETKLKENIARTYPEHEKIDMLNSLSSQLKQIAAAFADILALLPKDRIAKFDIFLSLVREGIYIFTQNSGNQQFIVDFDTAFENFLPFEKLNKIIKDYRLKIQEQKVSDIVSKILDIKRNDKNKEWKSLVESHLAQLQTALAALPQAALQLPLMTIQLANLRNVLASYNIDYIEKISNLPASNSLIDSLQENIKTRLRIHYIQADENTKSKHNEDAASIINEAFFVDPFELYQAMLEQANQFDALAATMFGNTVARINDENVPFHATIPSLWKSAYYHRSDPLDVYELFANRIVAYGGVNGKTYAKGNHDYIPILMVGDGLAHGVLENYAQDIPAKILASPEDENEVLAFIECSKKDSEALRKIFKTAGLIASPWTLSMAALRDKTTAAVRPTPQHAALASYLAKLPSDWEIFKTSADMQQLQKMSENTQLPTHLLAVSLLHLLQGLERYPAMSTNALQRLSLFLHLAVTFQAQNYENFACLLHAIVHEISLHINQHMRTHPITFEEFKREIIDNAIAYFGLDEPTDAENSPYQYIAMPSASGAHAFTNAMALIRNSRLANDIQKKIIGDNYYENVALEEKRISNWGNIYLISGGPIVSLERHSPGIDINLLIHKVIDPTTVDQNRGVVIVIDETSGLYRNLKLDEVAKQYVTSGLLSIIVHESKQKFGLLHTDQAQYGRVFAICGKKLFGKFNLQSFISFGEDDFAKHVDMQIGAYLSIHGKLEAVKERHFANTAILNDILSPHTIFKSVTHDPESLDNDETCFTMLSANAHEKIHLNKLVRSLIPYRDSYGHFHNSYANIGDHIRISVNASDAIDTLIIAQALHLSLSLSLAMTKTVLHELIMDKISEKLSLEKEILLISTLLALAAQLKRHDYAAMYYFVLGSRYLEDHARHLLDRLVLQKLMRYSDAISKIYAESVMPLVKHADTAINTKIAEALTILANSKTIIPEKVFAILQPENTKVEKFADVVCLLSLIPSQHDLVAEFCAAYTRDVAILDLIADIDKYSLPLLHCINIVFERLRSNVDIEMSSIIMELISASNFSKTKSTMFSENEQLVSSTPAEPSNSTTLRPNIIKDDE